jgi:hypothetical protein
MNSDVKSRPVLQLPVMYDFAIPVLRPHQSIPAKTKAVPTTSNATGPSASESASAPANASAPASASAPAFQPVGTPPDTAGASKEAWDVHSYMRELSKTFVDVIRSVTQCMDKPGEAASPTASPTAIPAASAVAPVRQNAAALAAASASATASVPRAEEPNQCCGKHGQTQSNKQVSGKRCVHRGSPEARRAFLRRMTFKPHTTSSKPYQQWLRVVGRWAKENAARDLARTRQRIANVRHITLRGSRGWFIPAPPAPCPNRRTCVDKRTCTTRNKGATQNKGASQNKWADGAFGAASDGAANDRTATQPVYETAYGTADGTPTKDMWSWSHFFPTSHTWDCEALFDSSLVHTSSPSHTAPKAAASAVDWFTQPVSKEPADESQTEPVLSWDCPQEPASGQRRLSAWNAYRRTSRCDLERNAGWAANVGTARHANDEDDDNNDDNDNGNDDEEDDDNLTWASGWGSDSGDDEDHVTELRNRDLGVDTANGNHDDEEDDEDDDDDDDDGRGAHTAEAESLQALERAQKTITSAVDAFADAWQTHLARFGPVVL